jgi:NAD(P)-dependent dehydrogenase (short-subunit alcohol dehydrogenase family)
MSRELGVEFARQAVRVNALCPGPVNMPLLRELFAKDPERARRRLVHIPMGQADGIVVAARFSRPTTPRSSPRPRSWSTAASTLPM